MEAVLIAVDDEWDLGFVSLIEPVASNALLARPAPQVACPLDQPVPKDLRLFHRLLSEAAKSLDAWLRRDLSGASLFGLTPLTRGNLRVGRSLRVMSCRSRVALTRRRWFLAR